MKFLIKSMVCSVLFASLFVSCVDEYEPTQVATQEQVANSSAGTAAIAAAIPVNMTYPYSVYGHGNNYGFDFGYPGIMSAVDHMTGEVVTCGGDDMFGYDWFTYYSTGMMMRPTGQPTVFLWNCFYNFIKAANDLIAVTNAAGEGISNSQKMYRGSAKAFRALLYLDMARLYEALPAAASISDYSIPEEVKGLTVPIITENTTEEESRIMGRATREEMFNWILAELDAAEADLTEVPNDDKKMPTLAVVYGLQARAYMWLGGFDNAKYADAAIAARKAIDAVGALPMSEAVWGDKITGFNTDNDSWMLYLPQAAEGVTNLVNFVAWRSSEATWGYGNLVQQGITSKLYEKISDTDWRKGSFVGPGAPYSAYNTLTPPAAWDNMVPYRSIKFRPNAGEIMDYKVGNASNIVLMRVEEMYLIEAEAKAHADAAAGFSLLKDFMATRDANYASRPQPTDVVKEIILQKRIEFWGEGIIFYDYKRLGMGVETGYVGTNVPTEARYDVDGRMPWWNPCIPEYDTNQNPTLKAQQNPDPTVPKVKLWTGK